MKNKFWKRAAALAMAAAMVVTSVPASAEDFVPVEMETEATATEIVTEEAAEVVTEAVATEEAAEVVTEAVTEAAAAEEATEAVTEAAAAEEATEAVTEVAAAEETTEAVTEAAATEETTEAVTEAAAAEEATEAMTEAATEEAAEAVTEAAEEELVLEADPAEAAAAAAEDGTEPKEIEKIELLSGGNYDFSDLAGLTRRWLNVQLTYKGEAETEPCELVLDLDGKIFSGKTSYGGDIKAEFTRNGEAVSVPQLRVGIDIWDTYQLRFSVNDTVYSTADISITVPESAGTLTVDSPVSFDEYPLYAMFYQFTPAESGEYYFYTDDIDEVCVYQKQEGCLKALSEKENRKYELEAGQTYEVGLYSYYGELYGSLSVSRTKEIEKIELAMRDTYVVSELDELDECRAIVTYKGETQTEEIRLELYRDYMKGSTKNGDSIRVEFWLNGKAMSAPDPWEEVWLGSYEVKSYANGTEFGTKNVSIVSSEAAGTLEIGTPVLYNVKYGQDVFYQFTPAVSGKYVFDATDITDDYRGVWVFKKEGSCLKCVDSSPLEAEAGQTYEVMLRVDEGEEETGSLTVTLRNKISKITVQPERSYDALKAEEALSKLPVKVYFEGVAEPVVLDTWYYDDGDYFAALPDGRKAWMSLESHIMPGTEWGSTVVLIAEDVKLKVWFYGEEVQSEPVTVSFTAQVKEFADSFSLAPGETALYSLTSETGNQLLHIAGGSALQTMLFSVYSDDGATELFSVDSDSYSDPEKNMVVYPIDRGNTEYVLALTNSGTEAQTGTLSLADKKEIASVKLIDFSSDRTYSQWDTLYQILSKTKLEVTYADGSSGTTGVCETAYDEGVKYTLADNGEIIYVIAKPIDGESEYYGNFPQAGEYRLVMSYGNQSRQDLGVSFTVVKENTAIDELKLNTDTEFDLAAGEYKVWSYTVEKLGYYRIYSFQKPGTQGASDPMVQCYCDFGGSDIHYTSSDDNSGGDGQFSLKIDGYDEGAKLYFRVFGSGNQSCSGAFRFVMEAEPTSMAFDEALKGEYQAGDSLDDVSVEVTYDNGTKQVVAANTADTYGNIVKVALYAMDASGKVDLTREVSMKNLAEGTYVLIAKIGKDDGSGFVENERCKACKKSIKVTKNSAHEHTWDAGKVTKEPTCKETGVKTYTCTGGCGETKTESIPVVGHSWDAGKVTKNATCKETGVKTYTCVYGCGTTKQETIAKTQTHSFGAWSTTAEATVFAKEQQKHTCSVCGLVQTREVGAKLKPVLQVTASSLSMKVKQSTTAFKVTKMANGDKLVSVTSSDKKIVTVSNVKSKGTFKLTAKKKGTAKLTITLKSGESKKVTVKVQSNKVKTSKITGVKKTVTLKVKKKLTLKPVLSPVTSQEKITYKSSNKKIATVSSKGVITAKKAGTAKITVTSGKKKVVCTVKVKK